MTELDNQFTLEFISEISIDVGKGFTTTEHFTKALNALSKLLGSPSIILTNVYKDNDNLELRLKNNCFTRENEQQPHISKSSAQIDDYPSLLLKLIESQTTLQVTETEVLSSINHNIISSQTHSTDQGNFLVTPFISNGLLVAILGFSSDKIIDFKQVHFAIYNVLNAIFTHVHQTYSTAIELNTYQTVLDLMPQRVFWKNRNSVYLGCNKAFSNDASLESPNDILGLTDMEIFPEQAELYRSDDANTMRTRIHLINSEEPQTQKNGEQIWLKTSKRPIITKDNILVGLVGTYEDITPFKNTQLELNSAKNKLEERVITCTKELSDTNLKLESVIQELKSTQNHLVETEKMAALGSLVAGVAHEINTPLGVAVTSSSHLGDLAVILEKEVNSGNISIKRFNELCSDIVTSSSFVLSNLERAAELVKNFKMIAVDQSHDKKRAFLLNDYLYNIVHAMTPKTNKKNIKIFLKGDEKITINTYPGTIAQIITKLIDNSVTHAFPLSDTGEINITYSLRNEVLTLVFEDDGQGINASILDKIFQPFFTSKRGSGGSGLGLSIVFNLVTHQLNGTITCESNENEWTRFTVNLPLD